MQKYGKKSCLKHLYKLGKNNILFSNRSASLCWFTNNVIRNGLWGTGGLWDISNDRCGCVWLPPPDRNHGEVCGGATCLAVSSLYNVISILYKFTLDGEKHFCRYLRSVFRVVHHFCTANHLTLWIYCRISLVNETLLNYFFVELRLMDHLKTLRRYLLMENGDFAQILSDMLFEKVSLMESDTLVLK